MARRCSQEASLAVSRRDFLSLLQAGIAGSFCSLAAQPAWSRSAGVLSDPRAVLLVTGILQPCTAEDVLRFMQALADPSAGSPAAGAAPGPADLRDLLDRLSDAQGALGWIMAVDGTARSTRYAVTQAGEAALEGAAGRQGASLRRLRDTTRLYLLRGPRGYRGEDPSRPSAGPGGDDLSPAFIRRVEAIGRATSAVGRSPSRSAPPPWSSSFTVSAPDGASALVSLPRAGLPRLFSFLSLAQLRRARAGDGEEIDPEDIALCLGISLERLEWMARRRRSGQYRCFRIRKKSGGERIIEAPFVPLKVVQRFILDFILRRPADRGDGQVEPVFEDPPLDASLHSFRSGRTPISNAKPHLRQDFVAGVDIEDFFGSVDDAMVMEALSRLPFGFTGWRLTRDSRRLLARLCTTEIPPEHCGSKTGARKNGTRLPQGGPASPMLSNLVLSELDGKMAAIAAHWGHVYTRYADDITFSGPDKALIEALVALLGAELQSRYGLRLNRRKFRLAAKGDRQVVTGVVVNEKLQPISRTRRGIRAAFDAADKDRRVDSEKYDQLNGYVGYLGQFVAENGELGRTVAAYKTILSRLRVD